MRGPRILAVSIAALLAGAPAAAAQELPPLTNVQDLPAGQSPSEPSQPEPMPPPALPPFVPGLPEPDPTARCFSRSLGLPFARGRLRGGVPFPAEGDHHFTWSFVHQEEPNPRWRRWGACHTVRTTLRVIREFALANPGAPRLGVGDLSRRGGGEFGRRFGGLGHASHQNGLDVDVYYPRLDRAELEPRTVAQVDRRLSQDLVNRFLEAGAARIFVGRSVCLRGPRPRVECIPNHDDHVHVRFPRR